MDETKQEETSIQAESQSSPGTAADDDVTSSKVALLLREVEPEESPEYSEASKPEEFTDTPSQSNTENGVVGLCEDNLADDVKVEEIQGDEVVSIETDGGTVAMEVTNQEQCQDEIYTEYQVLDAATGEVIMTTDDASLIKSNNQDDIVLSTLSETETSWVLKRLQAAGMEGDTSVIISGDEVLSQQEDQESGNIYQTIIFEGGDGATSVAQVVGSQEMASTGDADMVVAASDHEVVQTVEVAEAGVIQASSEACVMKPQVTHCALETLSNVVMTHENQDLGGVEPSLLSYSVETDIESTPGTSHTESPFSVQRPPKGNYHQKAYVKVVNTPEEVQAVVRKLEEVTNCKFGKKRLSKDYGMSPEKWNPTKSESGFKTLYTRIKYCHYANKEVTSLKKDQEVPDIEVDGIPFMSIGILSLECEFGKGKNQKGVVLREYYEKLARGEEVAPPVPPPVPEWKRRHLERQADKRKEREMTKAVQALQAAQNMDDPMKSPRPENASPGHLSYKPCKSRITPPPENMRAPRRPGVFPVRHKMHPPTEDDNSQSVARIESHDQYPNQESGGGMWGSQWQDETTKTLDGISHGSASQRGLTSRKRRVRKYVYKPKHNLPPGFTRLRLSKKVNCPVSIGIKHIVKFPDFKLPEGMENSTFVRRQVSEQLTQALLNDPSSVRCEMQYHMRIPDISCHRGHKIVIKPENYSSPDYCKRLLNKMYAHCTYRHLHLGDIQFNTELADKKRLHLHSLVLACASPYIHGGIEHEHSYDRLVEVVKDLETNALESFLHFVYTGDLILDQGCSIESLKQAFIMAKIHEGVKLCDEHLQTPEATRLENWARLCGLDSEKQRFSTTSTQTYDKEWAKIGPQDQVIKPQKVEAKETASFKYQKTKLKDQQVARIKEVMKLFYPENPVQEEQEMLADMARKGSATWEMVFQLIKIRFGNIVPLHKFREIVPYACDQCQKACKLAHHGEALVPKPDIQVIHLQSSYQTSAMKPASSMTQIGAPSVAQLLAQQARAAAPTTVIPTPMVQPTIVPQPVLAQPIVPQAIVPQPTLPRPAIVQQAVPPQPIVINPGICTPLGAPVIVNQLPASGINLNEKTDETKAEKSNDLSPVVSSSNSVASSSETPAASNDSTESANSTTGLNLANKQLASYLTNWKPDVTISQPSPSPVPIQFVPGQPPMYGTPASSTRLTQPVMPVVSSAQGQVLGTLLPQFTIPALNTAPLQIVPLASLTADLQKALTPFIHAKPDLQPPAEDTKNANSDATTKPDSPVIITPSEDKSNSSESVTHDIDRTPSQIIFSPTDEEVEPKGTPRKTTIVISEAIQLDSHEKSVKKVKNNLADASCSVTASESKEDQDKPYIMNSEGKRYFIPADLKPDVVKQVSLSGKDSNVTEIIDISKGASKWKSVKAVSVLKPDSNSQLSVKQSGTQNVSQAKRSSQEDAGHSPKKMKTASESSAFRELRDESSKLPSEPDPAVASDKRLDLSQEVNESITKEHSSEKPEGHEVQVTRTRKRKPEREPSTQNDPSLISNQRVLRSVAPHDETSSSKSKSGQSCAEDKYVQPAQPSTRMKSVPEPTSKVELETPKSCSKTKTDKVAKASEVVDGPVRTSRRLQNKGNTEPAWKAKFKDFV